mgnify:CR=1 FL=1
MKNYECLPGTPATDFGTPWYCCIRSGGLLVCEIKSIISLADAERKAYNLARNLMIASAADEMCQALRGDRHTPNWPVDVAGQARLRDRRY